MSYIESLVQESETIQDRIESLEQEYESEAYEDELEDLYAQLNSIESELLRLQKC